MFGRDLVGLTVLDIRGMHHGEREFRFVTDRGEYRITTDTYPFTFNMPVNSLNTLIGYRILEYRYEKRMTDKNIRDEYSKLIGVEPITNPIMWLRTEKGWTGFAFEADGDYRHVAFRALAPGEELHNKESKGCLSEKDNQILAELLAPLAEAAERDKQEALARSRREQEQPRINRGSSQGNTGINRGSSDIDLDAIFGSTMSNEEQRDVQDRYSQADIPTLTPNRTREIPNDSRQINRNQSNAVAEDVEQERARFIRSQQEKEAREQAIRREEQSYASRRSASSQQMGYDDERQPDSLYADSRFRDAMEQANQNPIMKAYNTRPDMRSQEERILETHSRAERNSKGNLVSRVGTRLNLF